MDDTMDDTSFLHFSFFSPLNSLADEIDMLERLWLSGICHNDKIEVSLHTFSPVFSFWLILTIYAEPWWINVSVSYRTVI